ncbi:MAG: hypothetical protein GY883_10760 [Shimia sp.]|nr:hypothetical protein [Shimia sp.]
MHVFIMQDHWLAGLACVQSFGRRGHEISLGVREVRSAIASSDYVTTLVPMVPDGTPEQRALALIERVESDGIDLVIPVSDEDALVVAMAGELRPDMSPFVSPTVEAVRICQDRNATVALCQDIGIATPKSAAVTRDTAEAAAEEIGYPCFLKLSASAASRGVFRLTTPEDLRAHVKHIPEGGVAQLQEELISDFGGICGFAQNGKIVSKLSFVADYDLARAGSPAFARLLDNADLVDCLEILVARLNWTGAIDLDLMFREDGAAVLLEINPRLSGSTNCALLAGIDVPVGYLQAAGETHVGQVFERQTFDVFCHVIEEARLRLEPEGRILAARIRRGKRVLDNSYPDDRGYARKVRRQARKIGYKGLRRRVVAFFERREEQA